MAIFGTQLVVSMIVACMIHKFGSLFSFAQILLCHGLVRFLHPTDTDLRIAAKLPQSNSKDNKKKRQNNNVVQAETFTVPRSIDIQLTTAPIKATDTVTLQYYSDYQWIVDFSFWAVIVYICTEIYFAYFASVSEFNVSLIWCLLGCCFCFKGLLSLTLLYFRVEDAGERIVSLMFGFVFLIIATGVLVTETDEIFDFELNQSYQNFASNARQFLDTHELDPNAPASLVTYKICLAVLCALIGAFLTFPGVRYAKMHMDAVRYARRDSIFLQLLLHLNFIMPLFLVLMWINPLFKEPIKLRAGPIGHKIASELLDNIRVFAVIVFILLRLALFRTHMQAYLNMAHDRLETINKQSGRISNIDLQKTIARVFYYLCVVAMQYVTPLLLLMFTAMLMKSASEMTWTGAPYRHLQEVQSSSVVTERTAFYRTVMDFVFGNKTDDNVMRASVDEFTLAFRDLKRVFTPQWYKGVLSFVVWWISGAWFTTSAFGLLYHSYF